MTKDEALKLALEALKHIDYEDNDRDFLFPYQCTMLDKAITAIKQALAAQPEPDGWAISYDGKTPYAIWDEGDGPLLDLEVKRQGGTCCKLPIYTTPPAAQSAVPDALTSADIQEHIEYVAGWNECRQTMLEILKARGNT
jgi:hypothetical protein